MTNGTLARAICAVGAVCAMGAASMSAHAETTVESDGSRWLAAADGTKAVAFTPTKSGTEAKDKKPIVLMLHGMCDVPENECPWFRDAAKDVGFLVCPRAPLSCNGGGVQWGASREKKDGAILGSEDAARTEFGDSVSPLGDDVIVGFSQGAYAAVDLAMRSPGRFSGLLLIGASVKPDASKLRDAGIRRVLLASGDFDGAKASMVHTAALLTKAGLTAKFVSTGKVGHTFPRDMDVKMTEALAWVRGASDTGS